MLTSPVLQAELAKAHVDQLRGQEGARRVRRRAQPRPQPRARIPRPRLRVRAGWLLVDAGMYLVESRPTS
jgi:hypothetical protein